MGFTSTLCLFFILYHFIPSNLFFIIISVGFAGLWWFSATGMNLRQKLAISTWSISDDGHIFAKVEVDATNLQKYIERVRQETGKKITVTHAVGRAAGIALENSTLNARIAFGRYLKNKTVDVSFLVALEDGKNLAPTVVRNTNLKSTIEICSELTERSGLLRNNKDAEFKKNMDLVKILPTFLLRPVSQFLGVLTGDLGIGIPALGLKERPFGSCMITSMGMLGVEEAFAPFTPFARVPLLLLVGAIKDQPAVREGKIVIIPTLKISVTMDHRYIDGVEAARIGKRFQDLLENPDHLDKKSK